MYIDDEIATLILEASFTRWLVDRVKGVFIDHSIDARWWYILDQADMEGASALGDGSTFLEALTAALTSLAKEQT